MVAPLSLKETGVVYKPVEKQLLWNSIGFISKTTLAADQLVLVDNAATDEIEVNLSIKRGWFRYKITKGNGNEKILTS